jgi:hypothetical protein
MSLKRSIFVALATMFAAVAAPAAHAQVGYGFGPVGYGYGQAGCGGCGAAVAYAPIVYAQPIAPAQIYVNSGCGNCGMPVSPCCSAPLAAPVLQAPAFAGAWGGCGGQCVASVASCCGTPAVYTAPAPVYMVDQGPDFAGPGIMEPYRTYAPPAQYAPPPGYPPYGYPMHSGYPRVAYHAHGWAPHYYTRPRYHHPYWRG